MLFPDWWIDLPVPQRAFEAEQMDRIRSSCSICCPLLYFRWKHSRMSADFYMLAVLCHNLCGGGTAQRSYILENRAAKFISGISMEIYLSHMVIFRVVEKIGLNRLIGNGWIQYIATVVIVLFGAILFSTVMQKLIGLAEKKFAEIRIRKSPAD